MICYNCGCTLSEHDFCTNCGVDVSVYKKVLKISNNFYNEGLERAGVRDLTGAIQSLRQCLKFNKNNVEARNLLGLVYFETGEVVAALSEWVISKNLRPKKNIADDYINVVQSNPTRLDTINKTIKKYNQALLYCHQDSKDLAIIQLKKVLSLNPKYVRAHQLLALLYIDAEDWQRAERELLRCEQIDTGNTTTKRYLKEVNAMLHPEEAEEARAPKKKKKEARGEVLRYQSGNETIIQPIDMKEPKGVSFSAILYLLIGLAIGVAATVFLILPARIQAVRDSVSEQLKTVSEQLAAESATTNDLQQKLDTLKRENNDLYTEMEAYVGTDGTIQTMDNMLTAVNGYLQNPEDVEQVAAYLESIQNEVTLAETSESFQAVYQSLLTAVGPRVAQTYYDDGMTAYRQEVYADAVRNLEKAYIYNPENADVVYNLANAYYRNEEYEKAAVYYQIVVDNYAGTEKARRSASYLEEINSMQ
ncbi:MAG: tetratricopeptide repeat protein [Lachnospiraceae bacterium]|nr:tetratricopeptide repeat protein [Lachnospiraceae bacterium]